MSKATSPPTPTGARAACADRVSRRSIGKGIANENGVLALRAGREEGDRRLDQLLDAADILDRGRRQIGPGTRAARRFRPAFEALVDRLERALRSGPWRQMLQELAAAAIGGADLEL